MAENNKWTVHDMPAQNGRVAVVTGGNSGIGFEAGKALAQKGAEVVLACRNLEKGEAAAATIRDRHPAAQVVVMGLDLADLSSVRQFAVTFSERYQTLNLLCNNAGVMALPHRRTADGFEMQFGTNHLGHFALTGLLLDTILGSEKARIVTVSSGAHQMGRMNFDDLNWERSYQKWPAYGRSKLANLLFAYELQRRLDAAGQPVLSVAAHPGYAATNLQQAGPRMAGSKIQDWFMGLMNRLIAQSQAMGALPILYAATAPEVKGGDYIGPDGFMEMRGHPTRVQSNDRSHNQAVAARLWAVSEELTGVSYSFG